MAGATIDYFFHLPARIISSRHRREMERQLPVGANPWAYYRVLITSVDYAKQPAIKNQILEHTWDAVVIDEAHLVAKPRPPLFPPPTLGGRAAREYGALAVGGGVGEQ